MNKKRRIRLTKVVDQLEIIADEVSEIIDEEQESYDNMPESLQLSDRGSNSEEAIDCLSNGVYAIEEAVLNITEVVNNN